MNQILANDQPVSARDTKKKQRKKTGFFTSGFFYFFFVFSAAFLLNSCAGGLTLFDLTAAVSEEKERKKWPSFYDKNHASIKQRTKKISRQAG